MLKLWRVSLVAILLTCSMAFADQIVLKNGDRLTGGIVKSDGKTLTIKSEYAGVVSVPMDAVTQITSEQPLYLTLKDSQTLIGPVSVAGDKLQVRTADAGTVTFAKDSIQTVRSKAEQDNYQTQMDRLRNPSLRDLWSGVVDTGLSFTRGNSETANFSFGVNAARATTRDKISVYMTTLYARNTTTGNSLVTANAKRGGARYEINISQKVFAFGNGDLENDQFQKLDLRLGLGGGMGWHAVKTERTTFDVFGGGGLNKEYYSTGLDRTSAETLIGQEFTHKLNSRTSFKERSVFLPNMSETGEYRFNFDTMAITNLSTWLGWTVTFSNRYVSNPLFGTKANDVQLTTGLRMTFGR